MSKFRLLQDFVGVTVSFRWLGVSRRVEDGVVDPLANILGQRPVLVKRGDMAALRNMWAGR